MCIVTDSSGDIGWLFLQYHPHHDGRYGRKRIPDERRLMRYDQAEELDLGSLGEVSSPCKDVLRMVVPQIHFCRPANRYSLCFSIIRFEEIRS